jgi:hypothetical protein
MAWRKSATLRKAATAYAAGGDLGKKALNLIEPACVGGNEMQMPARSALEPAGDLSGLARGIITQDEVHLETANHLARNLTKKANKFAASCRDLVAPMTLPVATFSAAKNEVAVSIIVVAPTLAATRTHGQYGLATLQGLDLALFIYAKHQSIVRRIHIEAHHIANLVHKVGIRKSEDFLTMRLQAESSPDAMNGLPGKCRPCCQRTRALVLGLR